MRWLLPRLPAFRALSPGLSIRFGASQWDWELDITDADVGGLRTTRPSKPSYDDVLLARARLVPVCSPAIAALVAEPIQASGGLLVPTADYLKCRQAVCRAHDILFSAEEVVTAFGRLGHAFASYPVFGIEPDMISFAKGVTSGYVTIGGVMISERIFRDLRKLNHQALVLASGSGLTIAMSPAADCAADG